MGRPYPNREVEEEGSSKPQLCRKCTSKWVDLTLSLQLPSSSRMCLGVGWCFSISKQGVWPAPALNAPFCCSLFAYICIYSASTLTVTLLMLVKTCTVPLQLRPLRTTQLVDNTGTRNNEYLLMQSTQKVWFFIKISWCCQGPKLRFCLERKDWCPPMGVFVPKAIWTLLCHPTNPIRYEREIEVGDKGRCRVAAFQLNLQLYNLLSGFRVKIIHWHGRHSP